MEWIILSSVLALVFALVSIFALKRMYQYIRALNVQVPGIHIAGTPEQIMGGQHLADIHLQLPGLPWG
jgi:hypothetical protein